MKRQGRLVRWEAERGFGFIRSPDVSADVFVHLRDFSDRQLKPQVGMELSFEEIHVGGARGRAPWPCRQRRPVPCERRRHGRRPAALAVLHLAQLRGTRVRPNHLLPGACFSSWPTVCCLAPPSGSGA